MPIESRIDEELGVIFTRSFGELSDQESLLHEVELGRRDNFKPWYNQLVDSRAVSENKLTPEGLKQLAKITPFSPNAKRVYLVCDGLSFGLANIFGAYSSEGHDTYFITESEEEAYQFLKLTLCKEA